jgi:hypothetical protein
MLTYIKITFKIIRAVWRCLVEPGNIPSLLLPAHDGSGSFTFRYNVEPGTITPNIESDTLQNAGVKIQGKIRPFWMCPLSSYI